MAGSESNPSSPLNNYSHFPLLLSPTAMNTFQLINKASGKALELHGEPGSYYIRLVEPNRLLTQTWLFEQVADGLYKIKNAGENVFFDMMVMPTNPPRGAPVFSDRSDLKWRVVGVNSDEDSYEVVELVTTILDLKLITADEGVFFETEGDSKWIRVQ
ncbi:hypothetical protein H0H93_005059, partial [Arthromyces matolae]